MLKKMTQDVSAVMASEQNYDHEGNGGSILLTRDPHSWDDESCWGRDEKDIGPMQPRSPAHHNYSWELE